MQERAERDLELLKAEEAEVDALRQKDFERWKQEEKEDLNDIENWEDLWGDY